MSSKILRAFKAFDVAKKSLIEYQIKFIKPQSYDEALLQMQKYFYVHETMSKSRGNNENSDVEDVTKIWRNILESEKVSIGCFEGEKIVGANLLSVKRKGEKEEKVEVS
jgi:hypothetical protein